MRYPSYPNLLARSYSMARPAAPAGDPAVPTSRVPTEAEVLATVFPAPGVQPVMAQPPALAPAPTPTAAPSGGFSLWSVIVPISAGLSAYHGYRRNNSIGWALTWGALGSVAPVITPAIAFAQGFGKPKRD